jgi:uncharacterized membrane protein
VVNAGIGGNQVVGPAKYDENKPGGGGPSALERLDRDVLSLSGVSAVIWLEGINDLGTAKATPDAVIAGSKEGIARLHARVFGLSARLSHRACTARRRSIRSLARFAPSFNRAVRWAALGIVCIPIAPGIRQWRTRSICHNFVHKMATLARWFIGIALVAFGIQHLVYREFVTRLVPKLPGWIPWQPFWACVMGAVLILAGAAIVWGKKARWAGILLGVIGLASVLLLYLPRLAVNLHDGGLWTNAGKALMLSGAGLLVARSGLDTVGRIFVSIFLILAGVEHFIYARFVMGLVPAWIPGHLFWTYFAGVALIAGGVGMIVPRTRRPAGYLSGIMILLWVFLLHIPRAVAAPHDANETTAVFEALAVSGAAFLAALL